MENKDKTPLMILMEKIEKLKSDYWERLCPLSAFDEAAGNLASQISTVDNILKDIEELLPTEMEIFIKFGDKCQIIDEVDIDGNVKFTFNPEQLFNETFEK